MSAGGMLFWGLVLAVIPGICMALALEAALEGRWAFATCVALAVLVITPALIRRSTQ